MCRGLSADYILPVEVDGKLVDVYVLKRPWCDHFMDSVGIRFEGEPTWAVLCPFALWRGPGSPACAVRPP